MNELKIFENEKFGKIRTVVIDGEPWWSLDDLIKICLDTELDGCILTAVTSLYEHGCVRFFKVSPNLTMQVVNKGGIDIMFASMLSKMSRMFDWIIADANPQFVQLPREEKPAKKYFSEPAFHNFGSIETTLAIGTMAMYLLEALSSTSDKKKLLANLRCSTDMINQYGCDCMDDLQDLVWRYVLQTKHPNEAHYYYLFDNVIQEILPRATIIQRKDNPKHIPDAWLSINGEDVPVEIKKGPFDNSALKQLLRYITVYGCSKGIAVGAKLTVELPENIMWISTATLEEKAKEMNIIK